MSDKEPDSSSNESWQEEWEPGLLLLGDFEVQRLLGRGGMGNVYQVRSHTTGMQFAVKRALIKDAGSRKNFLTELQTWIDLPEHPNIVACRFFRTIGDEIAIFSEFVGGGTLAEWIQNRKLTQLENILDVAIHFAQGLHAIHEHGLIHQDVKPGNVLITNEGVAKVTDFGLARARYRGEDEQFNTPATGVPAQNVLVSSGGMTPAYCSPEQTSKKLLSHKTDIWSWGVSVLDIFVGDISCRYGGQIADDILKAYLEAGPIDDELPRMPGDIVRILRKCFQPNPDQRWNTMGEIVEALMSLYLKAQGSAYKRNCSTITSKTKARLPAPNRETAHGGLWFGPDVWLLKAYEALGRNPSEREWGDLLPVHKGSQKAQVIADLAGYENACGLFEELISGGRNEFREELADLYCDKAKIHEYLDDKEGAIALYDRMIKIRERLVNQEERAELANALAKAYMDKAIALQDLGNNLGAVVLLDRVIEIRERLVNQDGEAALAHSYMNKAIALRRLRDYSGAIVLIDRAIATLERLNEQEGGGALAIDLARAYMNKAISLQDLRDHTAAASLYDRVIGILELLNNQGLGGRLAIDLADSYMNKANSLLDLRDYAGAMALYNRGIGILECLVNQEGRAELANDLARAYMNKVIAVSNLGDYAAAASFCSRAIEIRERLVNQEGRGEFANDLAYAYGQKALAVGMLGHHEETVVLYNRATQIRERLVNKDKRAGSG